MLFARLGQSMSQQGKTAKAQLIALLSCNEAAILPARASNGTEEARIRWTRVCKADPRHIYGQSPKTERVAVVPQIRQPAGWLGRRCCLVW
jgi:hypothetical protein